MLGGSLWSNCIPLATRSNGSLVTSLLYQCLVCLVQLLQKIYFHPSNVFTALNKSISRFLLELYSRALTIFSFSSFLVVLTDATFCC